MDALVTPRTCSAPALIALDWGTSSLRAFLMAGDGTVLAEAANAQGVQNLPEPGVGGFERAFAAICGTWLTDFPDLPVVAGGMVGSAQGWAEAPYVSCPADTSTLASAAIAVTTASGRRILIAPGVLHDPEGGVPDVIRGEEIQIAGALAEYPRYAARALVALPGTHCKWARIEEGRITGFSTYMTGEIFAVLRRNSILGRLMPDAEAAPDAALAAFDAGVAAARRGRAGDFSHQIFAARTLGLTGRLPAEVLGDYLSGMLIGQEVLSVCGGRDTAASEGTPLLLVGAPGLRRRYARVLAAFDVAVAVELDSTAPAGLYGFAAAAGLVLPLSEVVR